jgi:hypothetical protein
MQQRRKTARRLLRRKIDADDTDRGPFLRRA